MLCVLAHRAVSVTHVGLFLSGQWSVQNVLEVLPESSATRDPWCVRLLLPLDETQFIACLTNLCSGNLSMCHCGPRNELVVQ